MSWSRKYSTYNASLLIVTLYGHHSIGHDRDREELQFHQQIEYLAIRKLFSNKGTSNQLASLRQCLAKLPEVKLLEPNISPMLLRYHAYIYVSRLTTDKRKYRMTYCYCHIFAFPRGASRPTIPCQISFRISMGLLSLIHQGGRRKTEVLSKLNILLGVLTA